jgi:hypothetical protein
MVGGIILLFVLGLILILAWRTRSGVHDFQSAIAARSLRPLATCPLKQPFGYTDMAVVQCYGGSLRAGTEFTLLVGQRRGSSVVTHGVAVAQMEEYLGVYLPAGSVPGPGWLAEWTAKVAQRGASGSFTEGPPDALPYRAESTPEGGVVVNWKSAHTPKNLDLRLAETVQSLR